MKAKALGKATRKTGRTAGKAMGIMAERAIGRMTAVVAELLITLERKAVKVAKSASIRNGFSPTMSSRKVAIMFRVPACPKMKARDIAPP